MTRTVYPQERKVLSVTPDGKAKVWQGALDYTKTYEVKGKVVAYESYGGMAGSTYETDIRDVMVRSEKRRITSFLKMKERMYRERIPEVKRDIEMEIIRKFGTTNTQKFLQNLYAEVAQNPRLQLKTRHGQTIKTTLAEQKAFSDERNAIELGRMGKK